MRKYGLLVFALISIRAQASLIKPDPKLTPGILCSSSDPDFRGSEYPEKIARCNRNISEQEKSDVAAHYGEIPKSQWPQYEFDHLIPLCAGGSNNIENLWPQPIDQAKQKDVLEVDICTRMKAGTLKQAEAVQKIYDWFQMAAPTNPPSQKPLPKSAGNSGAIRCVERGSSSNGSVLSLEFSEISTTQILNPRIMIVENEKDSEVISAQGNLDGHLSRAQKAPLQGLYLFSVKENQDRFDVYLPEKRGSRFNAYVKLSFEDTLPKLIELECRGESE